LKHSRIAVLATMTSDGNMENFKCRRQTELKHGRIAMLATMTSNGNGELGRTSCSGSSYTACRYSASGREL